MSTNPDTLSGAALDALRERATAVANPESGEGWLTYEDFRGGNGYAPECARYLAACSPDVILALLAEHAALREKLATVRKHEQDAASDLSGAWEEIRKLRANNAALSTRLAVADLALSATRDVVEEALLTMREPMTLTDARAGRDVLTAAYNAWKSTAARRSPTTRGTNG